MKYRFYVKMDEDTFGPYSAKEVRDLQLMDDILVTEERMSEWLPAGRFDFDDMVDKELAETIVNEDGTINRTQYNTLMNSERPATRTQTQRTEQTQITSEQHTDDVPNEIKGWNWGAFVFSWIWGIFNGVYWPLVLIIVNFIPYVGGLISLGCCIALGINGSEWAWKAKSWSSVAEFKRVQHKWAIAILWVLGISFGLTVILIGMANSI